MRRRKKKISSKDVTSAQHPRADPNFPLGKANQNHVLLTCFAPLRLGVSLPGGVDRNHGDGVVGVWLQVLQHSVVGSAWNLDLESRATKTCVGL